MQVRACLGTGSGTGSGRGAARGAPPFPGLLRPAPGGPVRRRAGARVGGQDVPGAGPEETVTRHRREPAACSPRPGGSCQRAGGGSRWLGRDSPGGNRHREHQDVTEPAGRAGTSRAGASRSPSQPEPEWAGRPYRSRPRRKPSAARRASLAGRQGRHGGRGTPPEWTVSVRWPLVAVRSARCRKPRRGLAGGGSASDRHRAWGAGGMPGSGRPRRSLDQPLVSSCESSRSASPG